MKSSNLFLYHCSSQSHVYYKKLNAYYNEASIFKVHQDTQIYKYTAKNSHKQNNFKNKSKIKICRWNFQLDSYNLHLLFIKSVEFKNFQLFTFSMEINRQIHFLQITFLHWIRTICLFKKAQMCICKPDELCLHQRKKSFRLLTLNK